MEEQAWSFKDVPMSQIEFTSNFKQSYNAEAVNNYYNAEIIKQDIKNTINEEKRKAGKKVYVRKQAMKARPQTAATKAKKLKLK